MIAEKRAQALATLNTDTAILIGTKLAIVEDFRMLKSDVAALITGLTAGEGVGLYLGLAHGDMTVAEIAAAFAVNGPVGPAALTEADDVMKPVWKIGRLAGDIAETEKQFFDVLTGAPFIVQKHAWTFQSTTSWNWFVYNLGAQLTTGATVKIEALNFGVWVV